MQYHILPILIHDYSKMQKNINKNMRDFSVFFLTQCQGPAPEHPAPGFDPDVAGTPVFRSLPCAPGFLKREAFSWKGQVVDGRLQGPGKYKANGQDEYENTHDVCIEATSTLYGNKIENITGGWAGKGVKKII